MLREYLTNIANTLRSKLGITDTINAQDFPTKIEEVYNAGKEKEWSDFWDNYQLNGERTNYTRAFSDNNTSEHYWNSNIFKPKYDIRPINATNMFAYSREIGDLKQILNECNVVLDFSECTTMTQCFSYSNISHIPELDIRSSESLNIGCYNVSALVTIDKIILKDDGSQTGNNSFVTNAGKLQNLIFEGLIGANIGFAAPKLTYDSLMSIINHLQDLVEAGKDTCTLTIGDTNLAKLTDEEKAIATQRGWTLA